MKVIVKEEEQWRRSGRGNGKWLVQRCVYMAKRRRDDEGASQAFHKEAKDDVGFMQIMQERSLR